jgi:hypothetical protein
MSIPDTITKLRASGLTLEEINELACDLQEVPPAAGPWIAVGDWKPVEDEAVLAWHVGATQDGGYTMIVAWDGHQWLECGYCEPVTPLLLARIRPPRSKP